MADEKSIEDVTFELEQQTRRQQAVYASDVQELRRNLLSAAERFSDVADQIEKDRAYDPVSFLRASADRYRRAATK